MTDLCPIHHIPLTESPFEDSGKGFCRACEEEWEKAWKPKPKVTVIQLTKPPKVKILQKLAK